MGPGLGPRCERRSLPSAAGGTAQTALATCHPWGGGGGGVPSDGQAAEQQGGQFTHPNLVRVWVVSARVTVNGSHVRFIAGQRGHPRLTGSWGGGRGDAHLTQKSPEQRRWNLGHLDSQTLAPPSPILSACSPEDELRGAGEGASGSRKWPAWSVAATCPAPGGPPTRTRPLPHRTPQSWRTLKSRQVGVRRTPPPPSRLPDS